MSRSADCPSKVPFICSSVTTGVFVIAKLKQSYFEEFLLLPLLFNFLVLSQKLTVIVFWIFVVVRIDSPVMRLFLILLYKRLRILIFGEWIGPQIQNLLCLLIIRTFNLFPNGRFIILDNVYVLGLSLLNGIDNLYTASFFNFSLSLSLQQLCFKVMLFQLVNWSLSPLSLF